MPTDCPECVRALKELVQEIRKMTTKNYHPVNFQKIYKLRTNLNNSIQGFHPYNPLP